MVNLKEKLNICKKIYDEATKLDTNVIYNMNFIYSHDYGETVECDTLKNMIDVCFIAEKMAEFRKLKICKYCKTPFIAKNAKSEYDSIKCKNKENVYKFRSRNK